MCTVLLSILLVLWVFVAFALIIAISCWMINEVFEIDLYDIFVRRVQRTKLYNKLKFME